MAKGNSGLFSKANLMKYAVGGAITLMIAGKIKKAGEEAKTKPEAKESIAWKLGDFFGLV